MTENVSTATLKADLAAVMRDAEALMKASADQGGEKVGEARARGLALGQAWVAMHTPIGQH